jgi:hypothetical protein
MESFLLSVLEIYMEYPSEVTELNFVLICANIRKGKCFFTLHCLAANSQASGKLSHMYVRFEVCLVVNMSSGL